MGIFRTRDVQNRLASRASALAAEILFLQTQGRVAPRTMNGVMVTGHLINHLSPGSSLAQHTDGYGYSIGKAARAAGVAARLMPSSASSPNLERPGNPCSGLFVVDARSERGRGAPVKGDMSSPGETGEDR